MKKRKSFTEKKVNNRTFNIGLAILRMIICLLVVSDHCSRNKIITIRKKVVLNLMQYIPYHVPTFFIMSFFFSYNTFKNGKCKKKIKRFERLLIPYICWPIIILWINYIVYLKTKLQISHSLNDLIIQLLFAHHYVGVLWYQWDLIFISLIFIFIVFLFKKTYYFFLILLMFLSNYFVYSGKNAEKFAKYPYVSQNTYGRFSESIPFCVIGFFLADFKLIEIFEKYRCRVLFLTILSQHFFLEFQIFTTNIRGFGYQGVDKSIFSTLIFISFAVFPSQIIANDLLEVIIKQVTNYTMGIYVLHLPIINYMNVKIINYKRINIVHTRTLKSSLINYI